MVTCADVTAVREMNNYVCNCYVCTVSSLRVCSTRYAYGHFTSKWITGFYATNGKLHRYKYQNTPHLRSTHSSNEAFVGEL